jgi:tetratricopeptide (TPR) repeat protein
VSRVLLAGLALLATVTSARAQPAPSVEALRRWVAAVREHTPGKADASAGFVAGLKYSDRLRLNPAMQVFLKAVREPDAAPARGSQRPIQDLVYEMRANSGVAAFLRRAVILHTDAAVFAVEFPELVDDAPPPEQAQMTIDMRGQKPSIPQTPESADLPPLLSNARVMVHSDGRVLGEAAANWNWPFARSLVDLMLFDPSSTSASAERAFTAEWYHATSAYLFSVGDHADLRGHLQYAARSLPDDARIAFDRACYAETMGLAYTQVLRDDQGFWDVKEGVRVELPSRDKTDEEAEKLFRRALDVDPSLAEARVRLARLLERRGRVEEAAAQLSQTQTSTLSHAVQFYADLIAGRIAASQGRFVDAVDRYEAAATLYPDAQSALVGGSQAAVMASDVPRALSFVRQLSPRAEVFEADPWRIYHMGPGRDVDDLMGALWAHVAAGRNPR